MCKWTKQRSDLMRDIVTLYLAIIHLDGEEAIRGVVDAMKDVCNQWKYQVIGNFIQSRRGEQGSRGEREQGRKDGPFICKLLNTVSLLSQHYL